MSEEPKAADGGVAQAPLILADGIQIAGGTWSLMITLLNTRHDAERAVTTPAATVSICWPLAKALHTMLGPAIQVYEAQEGAIALPKSFSSKQAGPSPGEQAKQS